MHKRTDEPMSASSVFSGSTPRSTSSNETHVTETPLPMPMPGNGQSGEVDEVGPLVGRNFGGYEIASYIGDGPAGAVYRGEDLLGNAMAVKVLHAGLANRPRTDKLAANLGSLSALEHPALQKIYDTGYGDEGQFYYVTDELVGCDLETGLEDSGGLAPRKSYEILVAVCEALKAAHGIDVVHGGLRPRNVFLMPYDTHTASGIGRNTAVKVLDFGAAYLGGGSERGILAGLPSYLAPEQFEGVTTDRSDLYALGVLMHELFTGTLPAFKGGQAALMSGRRGLLAPPQGVDAKMSRLITSLLEVNPAARPASAVEVLDQLVAWSAAAGSLLDPHHPAVVRRRGPSTASGSIGPDSTIRLSKFDAIALAQETLPNVSTQAGATTAGQNVAGYQLSDDLEIADETGQKRLEMLDPSEQEATRVSAVPTSPVGHSSKRDNKRTMTPNQPSNPTSPPGQSGKAGAAAAEANPDASESVEASLEDFISQANATFPAADGWDLHTGDVELVEDEAGDQSVQPRAVAVAPRPAKHTERTEVVSQPLPSPHVSQSLPALQSPPVWSSPAVVAGLTVIAVVAGAVIAFSFMRSMTPPPVPQVIVAPVPAAPVVTALPTQPVTTALPTAAAVVAAPAPVAVAPVAAAPVAVAVAEEEPAPKATAPVAAKPKAEKKAAPAPAAAKAKKEAVAAKAAPKAVAKSDSKSESKPAKSPDKKKGGGDWVDPFAN